MGEIKNIINSTCKTQTIRRLISFELSFEVSDISPSLRPSHKFVITCLPTFHMPFCSGFYSLSEH